MKKNTMLKNALPLVTPSAFVALDAAATLPADAFRVTGKGPSVLMPLIDETPVDATVESTSRVTSWQPATGRIARRVEGLIVAAMCGYFVFGFLKFAFTF